MINDDVRQTIRFIIWLLVAVVVFYLASVLAFFAAGRQSRQYDRQLDHLALEQTPITSVAQYYHLDRGVNSYALKGSNKKGHNYYFIYLPHSKRAYLYRAGQHAVSASQIKDSFRQNHPHNQINAVNLGWYRGSAVWEVAYQKNGNGNLGYALYALKDGREINQVDNL